MKNLSYQEIEDAPSKIQFLYISSMLHQPVGMKTVDDAMRDHPEYFPDELEYQRKYALIPESVHEQYDKEKALLHARIYRDMPESKGILGWANDSNGYEEWSKAYEACRKIEIPLAQKLHRKFYSEYGIQWSGW